MNATPFLLAIPLLAAALAIATPAEAQKTGAHVDAVLGGDQLPFNDQTGSTGVVDNKYRLIFGGGGGYDLNVTPLLVIGIDANYDSGTKKQCQSSVVVPGELSCGRLVRDIDVGGRVGVKDGPTMLYGRVAYDNVLLRSSYTATAGATPVVNSNAYGGLRLAGGVEIQVTGPVFLKAEYRWTDASKIPDQRQIMSGIGVRF